MKLTPKWLKRHRQIRDNPPLPIPNAEQLEIRDGLHTSYRESDRVLVTICSAILGVSIPFSGQYITGTKAAGWIVASWIAYAVCVAFVLASLKAEQANKERLLDSGNFYDTKAHIYSLLIRATNGLAYFAFVAATALLVAFLILSALGGEK